MTLGLRATCIAGTFLALAGVSFGQTSSDYRALITSGGELKLLYNAQSVMKLKFGLFFDNWKGTTAAGLGVQPDGSWQGKAPLNPGDLNINTKVVTSGATARFTISVTPTRTLTANSSHVNVTFDDAFWAGATVTAGNWSATFPRRLDLSIYKTGVTDKFTVRTTSGFQMVLQSPSAANFALKDSRQYNIGFELRAQENSNYSWSAGVTRTYVVDVTPSVAMALGPDAPVQIVQNADWIPLDHKLNITPGSALDWSKPNPAYAGSKGWLKANSAGRFYFENEPNVPVRFYGTNITSSACFPAPAEADALASDLAKRGYNAVRLHHFDHLVVDPAAPNSTSLSAYWMDRFMYLIEAFKKKGMYVAIDLYSLRTTKPNEVMAGASLTWPEYKASLLCNPAVRQNYLTFANNFLNTYNPYSGKKIKDDPGIAWMSLVNENNPMWTPPSAIRSEIVSMLSNTLGTAWDVSSDAGARRADALLSSEYDYLKTQLRSSGAKALFTMVNAGEQSVLSRTRGRLDFVDNHIYYANPVWGGNPWELPYSQTSTPPISRMLEFGRYSASRVYGRPFTISEMDAVAPSPYRAEIGLTLGAIAAVQQWDAIFRFNFADRPQRISTLGPIMTYSTITDPAGLASERAMVALFLRGDVGSSDSVTPVYVPFDSAGLSELKEVPLVKNGALQVPMAVSNSIGIAMPNTPVLDGMTAATNGSVSADLFQQSLKVASAKTCGIIATPGIPLTAGRLTANIQKARASVWASSLDGLELGSSHRILLTHVTEVQNTGTYWTGVERSNVTSMGTLPHLARDGAASIGITGMNPSTAKVYRLDMSGKRLATVAVTKLMGGGIAFNISTRNPSDGKATIFYEIVQ